MKTLTSEEKVEVITNYFKQERSSSILREEMINGNAFIWKIVYDPIRKYVSANRKFLHNPSISLAPDDVIEMVIVIEHDLQKPKVDFIYNLIFKQNAVQN